MTVAAVDGPVPPGDVDEAADRLAFVAERLGTLRRRTGRHAEQALIDQIVGEVDAIRRALPSITRARRAKPERRDPGQRRVRDPAWQTKNRTNPHSGEEERFCPRHRAGHGAWVPTANFDVKDARRGTLRYACRDCWKEYQRERYVAANRRAIIIEVIDGDLIVGAYCNACGKPFEVGDLVVGALPRHRECCPTPAQSDAVTVILEPVT